MPQLKKNSIFRILTILGIISALIISIIFYLQSWRNYCNYYHGAETQIDCPSVLNPFGWKSYKDGFEIDYTVNTSPSPFPTQTKEQKEEAACKSAGYDWILFSDGCGATCNLSNDSLRLCTMAPSYSCDCGPDKCWNYKTNICTDNPKNVESERGNVDEKEKTVYLGKEFDLRKGEIAYLIGTDASLKITDFQYIPCPTPNLCFWSGRGVIFKFTVNGKTYNLTSLTSPSPYDISYEAPYDVFVKATDYSSYARFIIDNTETKCLKLHTDSNGLCWTALAKRFKNPQYCQEIGRIVDKQRCSEEVAEYLEQTNNR